jgi:hypothetical protein
VNNIYVPPIEMPSMGPPSDWLSQTVGNYPIRNLPFSLPTLKPLSNGLDVLRLMQHLQSSGTVSLSSLVSGLR